MIASKNNNSYNNKNDDKQSMAPISATTRTTTYSKILLWPLCHLRHSIQIGNISFILVFCLVIRQLLLLLVLCLFPLLVVIKLTHVFVTDTHTNTRTHAEGTLKCETCCPQVLQVHAAFDAGKPDK